VKNLAPWWGRIQAHLELLEVQEPAVFLYVKEVLGAAIDFGSALEALLFYHLFRAQASPKVYAHLLGRTLLKHPDILESAVLDLAAFCERDPAAVGPLQVFFFSKGFMALQSHRVAHALWHGGGQRCSAYLLQLRVSLVCAVDIHPAARLGSGIFLDHATGLVVGETAVVEDDVSILHEVTLGGTGKHRGDRHPKIRRGALLSAGAKILGNIEVGCHATVGAGSVVLVDVPAYATVAGAPAKVVGSSRKRYEELSSLF
jgi:serine O-acetyltransferase